MSIYINLNQSFHRDSIHSMGLMALILVAQHINEIGITEDWRFDVSVMKSHPTTGTLLSINTSKFLWKSRNLSLHILLMQ